MDSLIIDVVRDDKGEGFPEKVAYVNATTETQIKAGDTLQDAMSKAKDEGWEPVSMTGGSDHIPGRPTRSLLYKRQAE